MTWKSGCFAQDSVGDWWVCLPVEVAEVPTVAPREAVGLELGLEDTVATSDGEKLEAGHFYRNIEPKIAQAQRRGHRRQAKRLHRTAARRRHNALHEFTKGPTVIEAEQMIIDLEHTHVHRGRAGDSGTQQWRERRQ